MPLTRRAFLASAALAPAALRPPLARAIDTPRSRPPKRARPAAKKVALVTTAYYYLSHAYHIAGRFLDGYLVGDEHHFPEFGIASAYVEQVKANDLSRDLAKEHGFRSAELLATLPGERFYRALGYSGSERVEHRLRDGVPIEFVPMKKDLA